MVLPLPRETSHMVKDELSYEADAKYVKNWSRDNKMEKVRDPCDARIQQIQILSQQLPIRKES